MLIWRGERERTVDEVSKRLKLMSKPGVDASFGISAGVALKPAVRHPAFRRRAKPDQALVWNVRTCRSRCKGRRPSGKIREGRTYRCGARDGVVRSRGEGSVMGLKIEGTALFSRSPEPTGSGSSVDKAKPFDIPKREVWEAFKKVKADAGRGWS